METKRNLLAVFLISIIIILTPKWLSLFSPNETTISPVSKTNQPEKPISKPSKNNYNLLSSSGSGSEQNIYIETDLFIGIISNQSGGSFVSYKLKNYSSGYDENQTFVDTINVELINKNNSSGCMPCIIYKDGYSESVEIFNDFFIYDDKDSIFVFDDDVYEIPFYYKTKSGGSIKKTVKIYGNSYSSEHSFEFEDFDLNFADSFELAWIDGLLPTEKVENEDIQNASFIASLGEDYEKFYYTNSDPVDYNSIKGNASWVGIKNKYFLMSLIPSRIGSSASHSYKNTSFANRKITPLYSAYISFPASENFSVSSRLFLGPLDYNTLTLENAGLENAISFGWTIIHPFSKGILFVLMFLKKYINNYGLVLILFAIIVRIITGPFTKKAAISSQKMQKIQPLIKKIQKKHAGNPQKLNAETIALYKDNGVNPLGGCLPVLIQMPLLFSLFLVFRTTIEFRGASFLFWIKDLSQPDAIFYLPFSVPLYGSAVCVLPLLMSITMFIQQSYTMSSSTDKNQKIMMQSMSVVFFLIFNSFPSGLNLYYTVSNVLNIFQQRSIKQNINS